MKLNKIQPKYDYLLLAFCIGIMLFSRVYLLANKQYLYYDEIASQQIYYGTAVENIQKFAQMQNGWHIAAEFKNIIPEHRQFAFSQINESLAYSENHPPFYYWLMNGWLSIVGFELHKQLIFNIVVEFLLIFMFFKLFKKTGITNNTSISIIVAAILLHPFFAESFYMLRHYHLLALSVLMLWVQLFDICDKPVWNARKIISLFLIAGFGSLIHYFFPVVLAISLVVAALETRQYKTLAITAAIVAVAFAAVVVWQIDIYDKFIFGEKGPAPEKTHFFKLIAALPGRWVLTRKMVYAIPLLLLLASWPAAAYVYYKLRKNIAYKQFRALLSTGMAILFFIGFAVLTHKIQQHIISENRYHVIYAVLLFPALSYYFLKKYPVAKVHFLIAVCIPLLAAISLYQNRQIAATKVPSDYLIIDQTSYTETVQLLQYLSETQKLWLQGSNSALKVPPVANNIWILTSNEATMQRLLANGYKKGENSFSGMHSWYLFRPK
ncbi:hypothetical protein GC194_01980 [bacterium]|nr:hypothetical protein [bacterium]